MFPPVTAEVQGSDCKLGKEKNSASLSSPSRIFSYLERRATKRLVEFCYFASQKVLQLFAVHFKQGELSMVIPGKRGQFSKMKCKQMHKPILGGYV